MDLPRGIWDISTGTPGQKLTLIALAKLNEHSAWAHPSEVAELVKVIPIAQVVRYLRTGMAFGYVECQHSGPFQLFRVREREVAKWR